MVKNISVTQRLSVSWCSGNLMKIQFYCDGDLCFKDWIRVDGSGWICGLQSPTNFTKWIKSSVFIKFLNKLVFSSYCKSSSRSMLKPSQRSRHLFRSKQLEDPQADNRKPNQLTQFYSRQWHMDHGLWTLLLYFVRWVKFRIIDQQRVCTKCHPSLSPVLTNDFSRCEYARCSRLWSEQAYPVTICPIRL